MKQQKKSTSDQSFRASGKGTATLTGQVPSKPIQFKLTLEIPPPSDFQSSVEMPIVHQLASKALIHELQSREDWTAAATYEQRKKGIVTLSIESGVVSAHTAYIALDEGQEKMFEGAVKIWDVVATMAQYRENMSPHIPPRSHHFRRTESMLPPTSLNEPWSRLGSVQGFTRRPRRKLATSDLSTNSMANINDMYFEQESISNQSKSERLLPYRERLSAGSTSIGESLHSESHLEQDDEMSYSLFPAFPQASCSIVRPEPEYPVACPFARPVPLARKREQGTVNQVARPRDNLEFLIFLQKFEGFWDLDTLQ